MSYYNNQGSGSASSGGNYYGSQQQQPPTHQQQQPNSTSTFHDGYGDPNTWQQQQNQQQQQPYGQQPQQSYPMQSLPQQQPNVVNSFWDPSTAAKMAAMAVNMSSSNGTNSETMMLNLAGEASKSFLQSKSAQLLPSYMEQIMNMLRTYFAVDNRYVVLKMKRIIFPFLCKHWKRQVCI
jgi:YIF1